MATARSRGAPSGTSAISRCVCASAAATGVRNSCALLAVKLRSASSARCSRADQPIDRARDRREFRRQAPSTLTGDRSPRPRASISSLEGLDRPQREAHQRPDTDLARAAAAAPAATAASPTASITRLAAMADRLGGRDEAACPCTAASV